MTINDGLICKTCGSTPCRSNCDKRDNAFKEFVATLPATHWAKYTLSAVRLGWDAAMKKQHENKE